jgi:hypothetical protein
LRYFAPTGLAAFNINRMTLHRFFKLPIQNSTYKNIKLSDEEIKIMRCILKDIKLFMIGIK